MPITPAQTRVLFDYLRNTDNLNSAFCYSQIDFSHVLTDKRLQRAVLVNIVNTFNSVYASIGLSQEQLAWLVFENKTVNENGEVVAE